MPRLDGKICVVTGAARGIGRAIAHAFAREGGEVVLTDIDRTGGEAAAAEIGCRFLPLDVREEADWAALAREVPRADVVVNNAGVTGSKARPARTIRRMPAWQTGARSMPLTSMARSWAAAMRFGR